MKKLSKAKLALLERAFAASIDSAQHKCPNVMQTRSKLAAMLVEDGLLEPIKVVWHSAMINGFRLTTAGSIAYREQCKSGPDPF